MNTNKPLRIYLSKSKMGSMDTLMKVRDVLSYYENIQVIEFQGGEYNTDLLLSADLVIIIPPELPKPYTNTNTIGKGQHVECIAYRNFCFKYVRIKNLYFLVSINEFDKDLNLEWDGNLKMKIIEEDWKSKYASIEHSLLDLANLNKLGLKKKLTKTVKYSQEMLTPPEVKIMSNNELQFWEGKMRHNTSKIMLATYRLIKKQLK